MKRILFVALLSVLAVANPALRASADDDVAVGRDFHMGIGLKMWPNVWQTWYALDPAHNGASFVTNQASGFSTIPNISLRYKNFLVAGSFAATGNYTFGTFTSLSNNHGMESFNTVGSRHEADFNIGYYVHKNILLTMGYKGVTQSYDQLVTGGGGAFISETNFKRQYNGVTFGVAGSVPIGYGISIYGNGVGGLGSMGYTFNGTGSDATGTNASGKSDSSLYEASEIGFAYKPGSLPVSLSFGYKYQVIDTKIDAISNTPGYAGFGQHGQDITRGYIFGVTYVF